MKLSRNRTGYFIKEGVTSIFEHSLMSFASICVIIVFLVIMGSFALLAININVIVGGLESENVILAMVHENMSEVDAIALRHSLMLTPNVDDVRFITREQAFKNFLGRYDNTDRFREIKPDWLRHRYEVYVKDVALIGETTKALQEVYGVSEVIANLTIAQRLVSIREAVSGASVIVIITLLAISLFIMSNTIKIAVFERREEIAIMRVVGARNSFIRWPFIYEGFILGIVGAMAAYAIMWALYDQIAGAVVDLQWGFFRLIPFTAISLPLFVVFTAIGFGVGVGGSAFALNRYLKV